MGQGLKYIVDYFRIHFLHFPDSGFHHFVVLENFSDYSVPWVDKVLVL